MELVIKLSDKEYSDLQSASYHSFDKYTAYLAMKNGTPLPKGHGRLIDEEDIALIDEQFYVPSDYYVAESAINDAPTIIEASRGE